MSAMQGRPLDPDEMFSVQGDDEYRDEYDEEYSDEDVAIEDEFEEEDEEEEWAEEYGDLESESYEGDRRRRRQEWE